MIFKDTFEYLMSGEITNEQFAELMKLVYQLRWGDGVDESLIKDKEVRLIWRTLKHTVQKSKTNAKQYQKNKTDIQPNNEFENEAPNEVPNKIPSVQFEEIQKEKGFQKDFEDAVNQVIEIAAKQEQSLFSDVLHDLSSKLSVQYNKEYDSIKKLLYETAKAKCKRNKDLKEAS